MLNIPFNAIINNKSYEGVSATPSSISISSPTRNISFLMHQTLKGVLVKSDDGDYFIETAKVKSFLQRKESILFQLEIKDIGDVERLKHSRMIEPRYRQQAEIESCPNESLQLKTLVSELSFSCESEVFSDREFRQQAFAYLKRIRGLI